MKNLLHRRFGSDISTRVAVRAATLDISPIPRLSNRLTLHRDEWLGRRNIVETETWAAAFPKTTPFAMVPSSTG